MKKKKIAAIIQRHIDALKAGRAIGYWDARHVPTALERHGRVAVLEAILAEVGHKEAEGSDGDQD